MIEVELSFWCSEKEKQALLKNAIFLEEEILHDVYYDTLNKYLASKDMRLRTRNGKFMLKIALHILERTSTKVPKKEIVDESSIRELLNLPLAQTLKESIDQAGYIPFL